MCVPPRSPFLSPVWQPSKGAFSAWVRFRILRLEFLGKGWMLLKKKKKKKIWKGWVRNEKKRRKRKKEREREREIKECTLLERSKLGWVVILLSLSLKLERDITTCCSGAMVARTVLSLFSPSTLFSARELILNSNPRNRRSISFPSSCRASKFLSF